MDNFKNLIKEALTPEFLKESVNEAKYRVEYTTQDGEKAKSRVYNSKEEADEKEKQLVDSGIKQAKVAKVVESVNEDRFEDIEHMFSGEEKNKTPVLVDVWYSHHEEHGTGGVYKVIVHFDDESEETFYSLKDAEAKYDLEGVEREETEFDVS